MSRRQWPPPPTSWLPQQAQVSGQLQQAYVPPPQSTSQLDAPPSHSIEQPDVPGPPAWQFLHGASPASVKAWAPLRRLFIDFEQLAADKVEKRAAGD